jgi:hypothetical protein
MHFSVLVIGDDYNEKLAPFNEQPDDDDEACAQHVICTVIGADGNEYTEDTLAEIKTTIAEAKTTIAEGPYYNNTQGYWDWYVLGGRWSNRLMLKPDAESGDCGVDNFGESSVQDSFVDSALMKDIDFENMRNNAANKASDDYDRMMGIFGELPVHVTLLEMYEKYPETPRNVVFEEYSKQARILALTAVREADSDFYLRIDPDLFNVSKDEFIEEACFRNLGTFALINADGEWFGSDESSEKEYKQMFTDTLASLSPDTRISIIDCHV